MGINSGIIELVDYFFKAGYIHGEGGGECFRS